MNATSASPADLSAGAPAAAATPSRWVIDAPTRAFHWMLALSFAGAFITADGERWRLVHVTLGYTVIGLVTFRLLWALLGPRSTRFSAWAAKLRSAPEVLRSLAQGRPNAAGAVTLLNTLATVSLLILALLVTASGYALFNDLAGDWLEDVHEVLGNAMLAVALSHIALVIASSLLRGKNQALTMITGRVSGRGPDLIKRNLAPLAALMLAVVLGFWAWQWQTAPAAGGAGGPAWSERLQGGIDRNASGPNAGGTAAQKRVTKRRHDGDDD